LGKDHSFLFFARALYNPFNETPLKGTDMDNHKVVGTALITIGVVGLVAVTTAQQQIISKLERELQEKKRDVSFWKLMAKHHLKVMTMQQFLDATNAAIDELEFNHVVKDF
jgi:uncharacterized protein (DUF305 family)